MVIGITSERKNIFALSNSLLYTVHLTLMKVAQRTQGVGAHQTWYDFHIGNINHNPKSNKVMMQKIAKLQHSQQ